ncbi:unnamed protein product [Closterium sp. NIES-53]
MRDENNRILGTGQLTASQVDLRIDERKFCKSRSGGVTTQPQQSALHHLLSLPPAATEFPVASTTPQLLFPLTDQSQPQLLLGSPLPAPAPHTEVTKFCSERHEPETRPSTPVRGHRVVRPRAQAVPGTHRMALHPSSVPQRVVLPSPPASSLPHVPDPESDLVCAAGPTVTRLLATVVTDPSFESAAASALVAELVDFAALCRLGYAASLFELECLAAAAPHLASTLLCPEGDPDTLDIPTLRTYVEAITGPYSSQWQIAMDADLASLKSTGTYVDEVPPPGANIVNGMWIFRVKRPPGSSPAFKARYIARGFSQREGVEFFHNFSPTLEMTSLRVLLHVAAQRGYELHSLDFLTTFLQGSLNEAIWLRRPRGITRSFPEGTQWSLRRPVYGLCLAPHEWHDTLRTTLAVLGFAPSIADPSMFLRTDTSLPLFYVPVSPQTEHAAPSPSLSHTWCSKILQRFDFMWSSPQPTPLSTGHSLLAPPSDESVEPSGQYLELVGCLMYLMTCTRPDLAYPLSILARYVAPGRHRKELRWLTYLLTDLGERPRSPPILYVDNKAMIALCQDKRAEHRTKHIAPRYFLTQEQQQRGQLRLAYVATRANTAVVFTKALGSSDHQRFCTALGLVPTLHDLLVS